MMKRIFTLLFVMAAVMVNAQSIKVFYNGTELGGNDTVFIASDGHSDEINTFFGYQNTTANPIEFQVRKEVLLLDEEADISFCIGECYTGALSAAMPLAANETVNATDELALHVIYAGSAEPALVKFTLFRTDNENDKISFYVAYGTGTGIQEADMVKTLRAYPNPAVRSVTIDYVAPNSHSFLVIKNLTGREVYRTPVGTAGGKQIDVTAFTAGVYLYGIESDGKMLCTKKLLVK